MLEAGAITLVQSGNGEPTYARVVHGRTLQKLTDGLSGLGLDRYVAHRASLQECLVSAPGKVIMFGEHAVVHGVVRQVARVYGCIPNSFPSQTAIAAAVDLRCYGHVLVRKDGKLSLKLPDLDNFEHAWDIEHDLPWDAATHIPPTTQHPEVLDQALADAISLRAIPSSARKDKRVVMSCIAFLYLYMSLASDECRYAHFRVWSD